MKANGTPKCTKEEIQILTEPPAPLVGFVAIGIMADGNHDLTADTPDVAQIMWVLASVIKDLAEKNMGRLMVDAPDGD